MRILGIGSAGVTLLSALPDDEVEALYKRHLEELKLRGPSMAQLKKLLGETRQRGYADTNDLVTDGVSGVGMRFEIETGNHAAISIPAIKSRMCAQRKAWITGLIAEELRTENFLPGLAQSPDQQLIAGTR